jgi:hypothetical protein
LDVEKEKNLFLPIHPARRLTFDRANAGPDESTDDFTAENARNADIRTDA